MRSREREREREKERERKTERIREKYTRVPFEVTVDRTRNFLSYP